MRFRRTAGALSAAIALIGFVACGGTARPAAPAPATASGGTTSLGGGQPSGTPSGIVGRSASGIPDLSHIVVVVMENHEEPTIVGNLAAPYIDSLASRYGLAGSSYAISHPSLPNYLSLIGGSTFGITSDCTSCTVDATNLIDQLDAAGISWKAYMEGMPSPCFAGVSAGRYAKKHDPFLYFDDIVHDPRRCANVVPLTQLATDLSRGTLPRFAWITPDLCHDMHDCSVATGDRFLATTLPPILRALGPDGVLLVTFDEGTTDAGCCRWAAGGHVATILAGPAVGRGTRSGLAYDHDSVLRTIEEAWGLPLLRGAACGCTRSFAPFFRTG